MSGKDGGQIRLIYGSVADFLRENGPYVLRNGLLIFTLSVLHFTLYVAAFDTNLSMLFDAGVLARFFLNGFFLYSIAFAGSLLSVNLILGREISLSALFSRSAGTRVPIKPTDIASWFAMKSSPRVITHAISSCVFLFFYLGSRGLSVLLVLAIFIAAVYFISSIFRAAVLSHFYNGYSMPPSGVFSGLFGAYMIVIVFGFAMVSGELRARFVAENYLFRISATSGFPDGVYSVILASRAGIFVYGKRSQEVIFVPWDNQPILVAISEKRRVFGLVESLMGNF